MYTKAMSCIKINDSYMSDFFECNQGARQGENLSPLLFPICLNYMKDFVSKSFNGLTMVSDLINDKLQTKVLIFTNGKTPKIPTFSFNRTYLLSKGNICNHGKAMFSLIKMSRQFLLPIGIIYNKLFDHTAVPMLSYGCEIWGYENCDIIQKTLTVLIMFQCYEYLQVSIFISYTIVWY